MNFANEYRTIFKKVCDANPGSRIPDAFRKQFAAMVEQVWLEETGRVAKSLPGVAQVAGPAMVNDRLQQNFTTDVGFIGTQLFPNVGHDQIGGQYAEWDRDALKNSGLNEMADGSPPDEVDDDVDYKDFVTRVFGGRRKIGHLTRANARGALGLMRQASRFLVNRGLDRIERQLTDPTDGPWRAAAWAAGNQVTPATKWDADPDENHILKDIQEGLQKISNVWPVLNDVVFATSLPVWHAILRNTYMRGQGAAELAIPGAARFREMTGINRVLIGSAGRTDTAGYLGDSAGLFVAPMDVGLDDPTSAARVFWTGIDESADMGFGTRMFEDPTNYRTLVDVVFTSRFVVQSPELGVFYSDCLT